METTKGTVTRILSDGIEVLVRQRSACSGCHAKSFCTSTDVCDRVVQVKNYPIGVSEGDTVLLVAKEGMTMKAVLLAFVLPVLLILVSALVLSSHGVGDLVIALGLLSLLILYGIMLYIFRSHIERELVFWAEFPGTAENPNSF